MDPAGTGPADSDRADTHLGDLGDHRDTDNGTGAGTVGDVAGGEDAADDAPVDVPATAVLEIADAYGAVVAEFLRRSGGSDQVSSDGADPSG